MCHNVRYVCNININDTMENNLVSSLRKDTGKIKSITFASAEDTEFSFIFFFMSSCLCVLKLFSYEKNIFIVYWTTI